MNETKALKAEFDKILKWKFWKKLLRNSFQFEILLGFKLQINAATKSNLYLQQLSSFIRNLLQLQLADFLAPSIKGIMQHNLLYLQISK